VAAAAANSASPPWLALLLAGAVAAGVAVALLGPPAGAADAQLTATAATGAAEVQGRESSGQAASTQLTAAQIRQAVKAGNQGANYLISSLMSGDLVDTEDSVVAILKGLYCPAEKRCPSKKMKMVEKDLGTLRAAGHTTPNTLLWQEAFLDRDIKPLILNHAFSRSEDNTELTFAVWLWNSRHSKNQVPPLSRVEIPSTRRTASRATPEMTETDKQGEQMAVYSYSSLKSADQSKQTHNFGGVPVHVSSMESDGIVSILPDLRDHLRMMEKEWMQLPIKDWNDKSGSAFNSTSARYDQFNVLSAANPDDPFYSSIIVEFKQFVKAGVVNFLESMVEMPEFHTESEYWSGTMSAVKPFPLYIMCWVNNYYATDGSNNALHWHVHQWPIQGYVSVDSESSSTLFRSNVDPGQKWRFEHTNGMMFLLPGGTLHSSSEWMNKNHSRITVAFNLAHSPKPGFVWEKLMDEDEVAALIVEREKQCGATEVDLPEHRTQPDAFEPAAWAFITAKPEDRYEACMSNLGDCRRTGEKAY
jgi:hypothetical protein